MTKTTNLDGLTRDELRAVEEKHVKLGRRALAHAEAAAELGANLYEAGDLGGAFAAHERVQLYRGAMLHHKRAALAASDAALDAAARAVSGVAA